MSDPLTNAEIEDVLSSIRRLVSEDVKGDRRTVEPDETPARRGASAHRPAVNKLVLTQEQRVEVEGDDGDDHDDYDSDAEEPESVTGDAVFVAPPTEGRAAKDDSASEWHEDAQADAGTLEDTIAELEAAVAGIDGEFEPDGSEALDDESEALAEAFGAGFPTDEDAEDASDSAADEADANVAEGASAADDDIEDAELAEPVTGDLEQRYGARSADVERGAGAEEPAEDAENSERDVDVSVDADGSDAGWPDAEVAVSDENEATAAMAGTDDTHTEDADDVGAGGNLSEEPKGGAGAVAAAVAAEAASRPRIHRLNLSNPETGAHPDAEPEAEATADLAADEAPEEEIAGIAAGADRDNEEDDGLFDTDDAMLDMETLRELVAQIIRQELQGTLGERITRNVRKLVRREINRALESRDLE